MVGVVATCQVHRNVLHKQVAAAYLAAAVVRLCGADGCRVADWQVHYHQA